MKKLEVYYKDLFAGVLMKLSEASFEFQYDETYLTSPGARQLSINLPLRRDPYRSERLFPFFDNLIAEGWLLDIQTKDKNLNKESRFELIEEFGIECLGAVSLRRARV